MVAGGLDHFAHPGGIADIAGVDPQTGGPGGGSLDRAFVMKMDVGHDRHRTFAANLVQRRRRPLVRGRDAHNIGPSLVRPDDLA